MLLFLIHRIKKHGANICMNVFPMRNSAKASCQVIVISAITALRVYSTNVNVSVGGFRRRQQWNSNVFYIIYCDEVPDVPGYVINCKTLPDWPRLHCNFWTFWRKKTLSRESRDQEGHMITRVSRLRELRRRNWKWTKWKLFWIQCISPKNLQTHFTPSSMYSLPTVQSLKACWSDGKFLLFSF